MSIPSSTNARFSVQELAQVFAHGNSYDSLNLTLNATQWEVLGSYLQPFALSPSQVLIDQGGTDRTVYLVESGALSVHVEDDEGHMTLAMVNAGSVVGEGAFFSRLPRNASVVATGPCKLWGLTPIRFTEMGNRQPVVALDLAMALGAVVAKRLANKPKRAAVT